MRLMILTMFIIFYSLPVFSAPTDCKALIKSKYPRTSFDDRSMCYCGSQLKNLTVTLPSDLRVIAVCDLRFDRDNVRIDLNNEKLSLDTYRKGDYPSGEVYLSGEINEPITGTVKLDEGPEGNLWFHAFFGDHRGPVFWRNYLASLSLGAPQDYQKLRTGKLNIDDGQCWEADATLKLRNHRVSLGRSTTYADFEVIKLAGYKPCQKSAPGDNAESRLTKGQPKEVAELIHRIIWCPYFQGDFPYAEEYQKEEYATETVKLSCSALPKDEERVRASYINSEIIGQKIEAAKSFKHF